MKQSVALNKNPAHGKLKSDVKFQIEYHLSQNSFILAGDQINQTSFEVFHMDEALRV